MVGSDPAESSRLQTAPSKVAMTFSEDVTVGAGFLKVVDSKSNIVSDGTAKSNGRNVTVPLKPGLTDGSYIVSYRVISADSHPIDGAYAFVVGDGPLIAATGSVVGGGTNGVITKIFDVARFVGFLGVVLLGGLVFVVLCWPAGRTDPRARRLIWYGWWGATAGAVLGLVLQGPYAAGTGLLDLLNSSLLKTTLGTTYGRMLCARLILLGVLAVLAVRILREPQRTAEKSRARDEDLAAICGLGVLATYGGVGHAAAGSAPTLALLSDTSHLAAASVWIGGLIILAACLLPRRRTAESAEALPRYSRLALGCVAVLAVTGTYQAWREVWPIPALWSTSYGQLLLAKVIGFLLIVAVAYFSRQAVQRRYVRPVAHALSVKEDDGAVATSEPESGELGEDRRMVRRLRTSVGIELALGIVVLAVAAVPVRVRVSRRRTRRGDGTSSAGRPEHAPRCAPAARGRATGTCPRDRRARANRPSTCGRRPRRRARTRSSRETPACRSPSPCPSSPPSRRTAPGCRARRTTARRTSGSCTRRLRTAAAPR